MHCYFADSTQLVVSETEQRDKNLFAMHLLAKIRMKYNPNITTILPFFEPLDNIFHINDTIRVTR